MHGRGVVYIPDSSDRSQLDSSSCSVGATGGAQDRKPTLERGFHILYYLMSECNAGSRQTCTARMQNSLSAYPFNS